MRFSTHRTLVTAALALTGFASALADAAAALESDLPAVGVVDHALVGRRGLTAGQRAAASKAAASKSKSKSKSLSKSLSKSRSLSESKSKSKSKSASKSRSLSKSKSAAKSKSVSRSKAASLSKSKARVMAAKLTTTTKKKSTTKKTTTTTKKKTTTSTKRITTSTKAAVAATSTSTSPPGIHTLAPGTYFDYGLISDTLWWQSTGTLTLGCPSNVANLAIDYCFHGHLAATGNLQSDAAPPGAPSNLTLAQSLAQRSFDPELDAAQFDDHTGSYFQAFPEQLEALLADRDLHARGEDALARRAATATTATCPTAASSSSAAGSTSTAAVTERQRIEFYSWPGVPAGDTWTYVWKSYQSTGTKVTGSFFHSWQLLRRDLCSSSPVIGSDLHTVSGVAKFGIADYRSAFTGTAPSVALSKMVGKTIQHTVTVRYGKGGTFSYKAVNVAVPGTVLLAYSAKGDMGSSGSIKWGNYRQWKKGMSAMDTYVGDYSAKQVA